MTKLRNITVGEILLEEFLIPLGLSQRQLAREINVPANRISKIIRGERSVTAETSILLAKRFNTSPQFWLNLQNAYDLEKAQKHLGKYRLKRIPSLEHA